MTKVTKRAAKTVFVIPDLKTVAQLIDTACGDPEKNTVNFKLVEIVLVILARQLKILQRRVRIELPDNVDYYNTTASKLSVTDVKIHAKIKTKQRVTKTHIKRSPQKSMVGIPKISSPVKPSSTTTIIVKSSSSSYEVSTSEVGEQYSFSNFMREKLLAMKSASNSTQKSKSCIIERMLAKSQLSEIDAMKKHMKKLEHDALSNKTLHKSGTEKTSLTDTDDTAEKSSFSPNRTTVKLFSSDGTRSKKRISLPIKQRPNIPPTPENSLDSVDTIEDQYERLLVVERVPSKEASVHAGHLQNKTHIKTTQWSLVTEEEFMELTADVRQLQAMLESRVAGTTNYPDHLLKGLHGGVAWSDGIAALQISARLENAERALERMMTLVTSLARRYPDMITDQVYSQIPLLHPFGAQTRVTSQESVTTQESVQNTESASLLLTKDLISITNEDLIIEEDLEAALGEIYSSVMDSLTYQIDKFIGVADTALQNAYKLKKKVNAALAIDQQMMKLETIVAKYTEKINTIDATLTSEMTEYQDEIANMEYALHSAVDNMMQKFATSTGDIPGKSELISCFQSFETKLNKTYTLQLKLEEHQWAFGTDLKKLRKVLDNIADIKSDREEVTEALQDKVGFEILNSIASLEIFDAIRGDFEMKIGLAYCKFNIQEFIWQKAIDDLVKELDEKVNQTQFMSVSEDIMFNIDKLRKRLTAMCDIAGDFRRTPFSRKMQMENKCFSCSTPAYMTEHTAAKLPYLAEIRQLTSRAASIDKNKFQGVCFPGLPIPHSRDTRAQICHRYCGAPPKLSTTASRVPPGTIMKPIGREFASTKTIDDITKKLCKPCNMKPKAIKDKSPKKSEAKLSDNVGNPSMLSTDFRRRS